MDKKILKKLLEKSKTKGKLDAKKISKIASVLKRRELQEYLFLLRRARSSEQIIIETPIELPKESLINIKKRFKDKDIMVNVNTNLIAGLRFSVKDSIIDTSVLGTLNKIQENI